MVSRFNFQEQLLTAYCSGIFLLALLSSAVISWISITVTTDRILRESKALVQSFADQSALALLYESEELAQETAQVYLKFPDIIGARVFDRQGEALTQIGEFRDFQWQTPAHQASIFTDTQAFWQLGVDVKSQLGNEDVDFAEMEHSEETLGKVVLTVNKESRNQLVRKILFYNLLVSLFIAGILMGTLILLTKRITRPIRYLSEVMQSAEGGRYNTCIQPEGPRDLADMMGAFNKMIGVIVERERDTMEARDQALEAARIKGKFAANVTHELRTPMNGILGMLELLTDFGLNETQSEYVRIAKTSAQSLLGLIDDVLDFSKSEAGRLELDEQDFSLLTLLDDVVALLSNNAQDKNLELYYVLAEDIPRQLFGDMNKLRQVFINLVGNAIKFTTAGYVEIKVELQRSTNELVFSISDSGIGIDKKSLDSIFEAFSQADNSTTREYGGTGLGLAICREIVHLMRGKISAESELGRGSCFFFSLPLQEAKSHPEMRYRPIKGKLLLASDNIRLINSITTMLVQEETQLTVTKSIIDGLEYLDSITDESCSGQCGAIIIDEALKGYERLLRKLRSGSLSYIPVIALSNVVRSTDYQKDVDINVFLPKPLHRKRLLGSLNHALLEENIRRPPQLGKSVKVNENPDVLILLCEDNPTNSLVASKMLDTLGYRSQMAENGAVGLEKLASQKFDIVLMDCHMPVMDGYETTKQIRARETDTSDHQIIIATTANTAAGEREQCIAAGMDDYIAKPINREELGATLKRWLADTDGDQPELPQSADESTNKKAVDTDNTEDLVDSATVIDMKTFSDLKDLLGDQLSALVECYINQQDEYLTLLEQAIIDEDSNQVRLFAHSIKGGAGNIGASRVAALGKRLEYQAKDGDLTDAVAQLNQLRDENAHVIEFLEGYREACG